VISNRNNIDIVAKIKDEINASLRHSSEVDSNQIIAVYVFGSTVSGKETAQSDIDLAFLVAPKAYKTEPVHAIQLPNMVATQVGLDLNKETDITILNTVSLEIAYEIITTGECIYENDSEKRLTYEISLKGMYFDFKPFIDELRSRCISDL
jgi:predicted nucleotidyltransferase